MMYWIRLLYLVIFIPIISHGNKINNDEAPTIEIRYLIGPNKLVSNTRVAYEIDIINHLPKYANDKQTIILKGIYREMSFTRSRKELTKGQKINLLGGIGRTDIPTDAHLIPFPLMKGLLGYREIVIHQDNRERLSHIASVEDLQKFTIGQGQGWAEVPFFKQHNLKITTGDNLPSLFKMLARKRFDLLPLGSIEARHELSLNHHHNLEINNTLLYYPLPVVFFVNKNETELIRFLEMTLIKMNIDGTLDRLLEKHFSRSLEKIKDHKTKIIRISNPYIPNEIPLDQKTYWLNSTY